MKRKNKRRSMASKMISIMLIICFTGMTAIIAISAAFAGTSILNESLAKISNKTTGEAGKIESWLKDETSYISAAAEDMGFAEDYSSDALVPLLQAHAENRPVFFSVYAGFPDGSAAFNDSWIPDADWIPYERDWYKGAVTDPSKVYISSIYTDAQTKELCATISKAFINKSTGAVKGVFAADVLMGQLRQTVFETDVAKDSYAFVLDSDGNILIHPDDKYQPVNQNGEDVFQNIKTADNGILSKMWDESSRDNKVVKAKGPDGTIKYYTSYTIPTNGWILYTAVPSNVVYSPIYRLLLVIIPISAALIIILVIIAFKIIKSIDKILINAAVQLQQSASGIIRTADEMSETSGTLAQSGNEQTASIEETSAAMNETASMVEQNTKSTRQALLLTKETSENTGTGMQKITNLINFMDELSKSSHAISNVINTISGIASQTNILALNASVESARAGEAGKAFAVVSEEVRALAQKCNDAVKSTSEIIENNVRLTELSIENSHEVSMAFDTISNKIEKVNQIVAEITSASEEQSKSVKYVNGKLSQMEKVTQSNAVISKESTAAANELKSQADILQELTDNINKLVGYDSQTSASESDFIVSRRNFISESPLTASE